jgi:hypothetical protein
MTQSAIFRGDIDIVENMRTIDRFVRQRTGVSILPTAFIFRHTRAQEQRFSQRPDSRGKTTKCFPIASESKKSPGVMSIGPSLLFERREFVAFEIATQTCSEQTSWPGKTP